MYPLTFDHLKLEGKTSVFSNYVFAPSMEQKLQYRRQKNLLQLHPLFFSLYILVFLPLDPLVSMGIQIPLLSQCGSRSRSGFREPNQCGSRSGSWSDFKVIKNRFLHDNILEVGSRLKNIPTKLPKPFLRQEASFIC